MSTNIIIERYDPNIDSLDNLIAVISEAEQKSKKFFEREVGPIKYNFLYSRQEMDEWYKQKTADWLVGTAKNGKIAIFSQEVFERESTHQKSDFFPVLVHEIAHVYTNRIIDSQLPIWLNEGISQYVAEQKLESAEYGRVISQSQNISNLNKMKSWNKTINHNPNYEQAYLFTSYIIDSFGKKEFLEFVNSLKPDNIFKRVFFLNNLVYNTYISKKMKTHFGADLETIQSNWKQELIEKYGKR